MSQDPATNPYASPEPAAPTLAPAIRPTPGKLVPFESAHGRAIVAMCLLAANILIDCVAIGSDWQVYQLNERAAAGHEVTEQQARQINSQQEIIGVLKAIVLLSTAVVFLMWVHRACRNLPALGSRHLKYSPGWCAGSYFVPILSLFRPYQGMVQIWKGSSPDPENLQDSRWESAASTPLLGFWWAAWIGANLISQFSGIASGGRDDSAALNTAISIDMFVTVLSIIAAALLITLVRQIDQRQDLRYERIRNMTADGQTVEVATLVDPFS